MFFESHLIEIATNKDDCHIKPVTMFARIPTLNDIRLCNAIIHYVHFIEFI